MGRPGAGWPARRSAVEHRPADVVAQPLVVEHELPDPLGELPALPGALAPPRLLGLTRGRGGADRLDGVGGGAEPLSNPGAVLDIARSLLRGGGCSEPLPPLVESLANLLKDLGSGPASRASKMPSRAASEERG